ncbi:MAG: formyltransferase family protein [Caldilineaceae bacterium]
MPTKLAVLISGNGTNLQAIIDAIRSRALPAEIVVVVSNRADAYGLERAEKAGIPTRVHTLKPYRDAGRDRREYDADLVAGQGVQAGLGGTRRVDAHFEQRVSGPLPLPRHQLCTRRCPAIPRRARHRRRFAAFSGAKSRKRASWSIWCRMKRWTPARSSKPPPSPSTRATRWRR